MNAPLLSDLREPPVVGRFYMVPVIGPYPYCDRRDDWPVIGALHEDRDAFNFPDLHYHIDARFLTAAQERAVTPDRRDMNPVFLVHAEPFIVRISGTPLVYRGQPLPKGRPRLKRLKCRRSTYESMALRANAKARAVIEGKHGQIAEPIRRKDGRLLCPHRKLDLSQFVPDVDGIVTCPLHGLRVRCGVSDAL